jgi:polysaccharide export outer membrane protein
VIGFLSSFIRKILFIQAVVVALVISGCSTPSHPLVSGDQRGYQPEYDYVIGPGDAMEVFVWGNEELTISGVQVRPDGKITTRLVENIPASGKTPSELARDIEKAYGQYVKHPIVSVIVSSFIGIPSQQIRVVGEAAEPLSVPFRQHMTLLDLMVEVGGLTEFAAGNEAVLVRNFEGSQKTYTVLIEDLIEDGDISANIALYPGDILIIPEAWF